MSFKSFLVSSLFMVFSIATAFAGEPEFVWSGYETGKIIYPADKYSSAPHEFDFDHTSFVEISEKVAINQDSSPEVLRAFAKEGREQVLKRFFSTQDFDFLVKNGHLKSGVDFIEKIPGNVEILGTMIFLSEISLKSEVSELPLDSRLVVFGDVAIATHWKTGKRRVVRKPGIENDLDLFIIGLFFRNPKGLITYY